MRCAVITPVGPGHEKLFEQCSQSVKAAIQHSRGPFSEITIIAINDTSGAMGRSAARNEAVRRAKSADIEWLFFIDADDLCFINTFDLITEYVNQYDAIWGTIVEILPNSNQATLRIPQILTLSNIKELLLFDPYFTLQMGHFIRTEVAIKNPFNASMNTGEDFDYYLRVWSNQLCIKIKEPLFINRRGMHSGGPKAANGRDWRRAVEQKIIEYKKIYNLEENIESLKILNNKALEFAKFAKQYNIANLNNFLQLSGYLPYHGYYKIDCFECPVFRMLSKNDDLVVNSLIWTGGYKPASLRLWARLAEKADLVFDIGAYTGIYGLVAAQKNNKCSVFCFEPLYTNVSRINENISLNRLNNVVVVPYAISNTIHDVNLNIYSDGHFLSPESSIKNTINKKTVFVKKVQSISIDTFVELNSIKKIDLLKIDVNGSESEVILGMRKTLEKLRPDILMSVSNDETAQLLTEIFNKLGYNFFQIEEDSLDIYEAYGLTSSTGLTNINYLITMKNRHELDQEMRTNEVNLTKYETINIIPKDRAIDYKKYWESDNLQNIIPSTNDQYPEGWDPSEILKEILTPYDVKTALDLGCGYGRLCKAFAPHQYIGVDLNPNAIREAKIRYPEYIFREINIDSKFDIVDLVLAYTVFLHIDDDTLDEILIRLCKSCKNLLVIGEILGREWRRPGNPPVFNRNLDDYIHLISKHGFKLDKEYKRPYQRYASSSYFKDKNTDLSFLIFRKSTELK